MRNLQRKRATGSRKTKTLLKLDELQSETGTDLRQCLGILNLSVWTGHNPVLPRRLKQNKQPEEEILAQQEDVSEEEEVCKTLCSL